MLSAPRLRGGAQVDGVEVLNLAHLKALVEGGEGRWVRLELEEDRQLVLDRHLAAARGPVILRRYRVPSPMSPDLLPPEAADAPAATAASAPAAAAASAAATAATAGKAVL
jgi:hypothetical protein